ncbi:MAG: hypothetical protein PHR34_00420 [Kiritimatiellae bacterium]|nr:hypothetical protein [Kiritimatiellia bacterium]MDD3441422.1 hypothetical protein [Kiritimatiellia bacterium]
MKKRLGVMGLVALAGLAVGAAGGRVGGDAEILYERVGAGGATFASAGVFKLGGSVAQGLQPWIATNTQGEVFLNGFWKAEDACTLYNPRITDIVNLTNQVGITFLVVNSNAYSVEYVDIEPGGLTNGVHWITNEVAALTGEGLAGSTTTVWHNVSTSTNRARFYLIRCE